MARQMKDSGIEWIGEIPHDWADVPLQYHADLNTESLGEDTAPDYEFNYVEIGSVTLEGGINEYEHVRFADAPSRARRVVKANDIIVSTVRTYLKAIAIVPARENVIVSTGFAVLTPKDIDVGFLGFFLKSDYFVNLVTANSVGISYPAINASDLVKFKILLPSIEEQQRIAAFLDRKCAEIDAVIERTKATIEEYKKLKQAVITEAVTKGVRGPRPMKDSGIEWIGEIPEGWATVQLKRLARIATGSTPPKNEESTFYSQDSGCLWIKAEDLGTSNNIETTTEYLTEAGKREGRIFPPCTVYVCCIASVGKVGYCVTEASCNQQINGLIFENAHWKYGFYLSLAQEEEYLLNASGNVMKILNTDKQSRLMCPCPPVEEQVEIATFLDGKCAALDTLIAKKTALLTELETYKKSLIYEYVTGKKEV